MERGPGTKTRPVDSPRVPVTADDDTVVQDDARLEEALELSRAHREPPAELPGYTVLGCLGDGAYGSVWLAREENTGKQVAIKFYTHRRGLDWSLLNREVEKLAVLYTDRNIVGLLEVGWNSDPPYYVMEFLDNGSLAGYLTEGPLSPDEAVRVAKGVLRALSHAHGSGILHCDMKPANVLLDSDLEPRICDFGQSRLSHEQNPALGTMFYMAPEQADLDAIPDARWDVYALGAILYQMLTGAPPYRTPENERKIRAASSLDERLAVYRSIVHESPKPSVRRQVRGIDRRLAEIVERCLETDPEKRFPNAQAVLDVLELRDRHRARRPLVALGVVGPALLLVAMALTVGDVMRNAVQTAERNMTNRALESDALSARILARSLERELADRKLTAREVANDPDLDLRGTVRAAADATWEKRRDVLFQDLLERKRTINRNRAELDRSKDTSWFVNDREGRQLWRHPYPKPDSNTIDKNYAFRDYFHGHLTEYEPHNVPENIEPITEPHVSLPFRSQATHRYMIAIAVPIWNAGHDKVIAILGRTAHLEKLLGDYEPGIRGEREDEVDRVMALLDSRDWKLLGHPWMKENLGNLSGEKLERTIRKLRFDEEDRLTEKLQRLKQAHNEDHSIATHEHRFPDYTDPVGKVAPEKYGGTWLAAFSPVGETGWMAVVQERSRAAMQPVREMEAGLIRYGIGALIACCGLIGILWYFVLRAIGDGGLGPPERAFVSNAGRKSE